ncbi:MAG: DNA alkylation repair protein [bacterium]
MTELEEIKKILQKKSSSKVRDSFKKFIPNSQNVYGVRVPDLNELATKYKDDGFMLVELLWRSGAFEERLLAAKILAKASEQNPDYALKLIELFSKDISDWAVCDTLGQQGIKPIAKLKQKEIFDLSAKLVKSSNFWQRRLSLVLLENYKKEVQSHKFILNIMKRLENDKEYYVKKAVEWTKRDLAKFKK